MVTASVQSTATGNTYDEAYNAAKQLSQEIADSILNNDINVLNQSISMSELGYLGIGETGPTGSKGETGPTGLISLEGNQWGKTINWNNITQSWQITGENNLALGLDAGQIAQGTNAIALGFKSGNSYQQFNSIAIGQNAGLLNQGGITGYSIAIGADAGYTGQGSYTIAIGAYSGRHIQSQNSIAIGLEAGFTGQGGHTGYAVALGAFAGWDTQGENAIAIGNEAGLTNQGSNAIAIGHNAGGTGQVANAIAIGQDAGSYLQGTNSIAIGQQAGQISQPNNSIVINASGLVLNGTNTNAFYVRPIRSSGPTPGVTGGLIYDPITSEITYTSAKTFVIDHPDDKEKLLVHGCLEGPEGGVYYRGKDEITNGESKTIILPDYVKNLAKNFTVQITPIYNAKNHNKQINVKVTEVEDNSFTVYCDNTKFFWFVIGERVSVEVEPYKKNIEVKGDGPYTWI